MTPAIASSNDGVVGGMRLRPDESSTLHLPHLSDIDLRGLGRTIWRWRAMVIWTTLALTAMSVVIIQHLTPLYTASGQVLVGVEQVKVAKIEDLAQGTDTQSERVATEIGVIRARDMAVRVISKLGLENDPEFNTALRSPTVIQGWLESQSIIPQNWLVAIGAIPDLSKPIDPGATASKTVDNFMEKLKVTNDGQSRIINISFESRNPDTAAQVVNALADAYIVARLDQKFDAAKRANVWLSSRVDSLRQEVLTSEDAVEKFRAANGLERAKDFDLADRGDVAGLGRSDHRPHQAARGAVAARAHPAIGRRAERHARRLARRGAAIAGHPGTSRPRRPTPRAVSPTSPRNSATSIRASSRRGPSCQDLRAKIKSETGKVVESLRQEAASQQAREAGLDGMLDGIKQQSAKSSIADVQLRDLERQAEANRTLYENFLNQFKLTSAQDQFQQPDASIISRAEMPREPSFPQKGALILLSGLASLTLGVFLALLAQYLDVGVRSMEQVKTLLHVYPLGMVPAPQGLVKGKLAREIIDHPMSGYSEAVRTVHTNLMLSDVDQRPRVVLVTSSLPGEGKSTLSVSLAELAARYGQKVCIIDADLRRPTIHRLAGAS